MSTSLSKQLETEGLSLVDCDLHVYPPDKETIIDRLPERYRGKGLSYPDGSWASPVGRFRDGTVPEDSPGGSDPGLIHEQHLDGLGIDRAVVTGSQPVIRAAAQPDRRYAAALCRAYNDWLVDKWFEPHDRLRGSIAVAPVEPEAAAEEIHRLGDRPDVVQVIIGGGTQVALGEQRYWPIYEAAVDEGLPVAIHAGAEGYGVAHANSGAGYPSTYLEAKSVVPANFMGQLLNFVLEGPFVEYPELRIVMIGSGYSWIPSFLWRIDKAWKGLNDDMPWVQRPPSEYVHEQVRFVTHPVDEPDDPDQVRQMLEMIRAEQTLMFGSNYPHWDSFAPGDDLPDLPKEMEQAIFSENARELYDL